MSVRKKLLQDRLNQALQMGELIDPEDIQDEYYLQHTKWFEYGFMTPWAATIKFTAVYNDLYRQAYMRNYDREHGKNTQGRDLRDFLYDNSARALMWRARQRADLVGMRYEEYCAFAMEFATRRIRKHLPQPNQLHFPGKPHELWCTFRDQKWHEYLAEGLVPPPANPAYRTENFKGLPIQQRYRSWILRQASSATRVQDIMRLYSIEKAHLPVEAFKDVLADDLYNVLVGRLESEVRHHGISTDPLPATDFCDFMQSCFGLPGLPKDEDLRVACKACPLQDECVKARGAVENTTLLKHGTNDPVGARRKQVNNERQRRHRAKLRAMKAAALVQQA